MGIRENISIVEIAEGRRKAATEDFICAVKTYFPVGSIVDVETGNTIITVEITDHHDCWWHDPGRIRGVNVRTGKTREFDYSQIVSA